MNSNGTLYQTLLLALRRASDYNKADAVAPVAVLWTDSARQWEPLLPRLREDLPILTLGSYDPATRTGPAIWLRCMIARTLPGAGWPADAVPILYLPGISRQELRAVDECPAALQPLVELQYRGVLWSHRNGRDWTVAGFLQSSEDLNIEVAGDTATKEALLRTLPKLADEPAAALRSEAPLTAAKLNALLNPEPVRNLLLWMNSPTTQKARRTEAEWEAFRDTCRHQFDFNPETDGEITAALLLGKREGIWQSVWGRFAEAPARYPDLPALLRRARPQTTDALFHHPSSWPQDNEAEEAALRAKLLALADSLPAARSQIKELEKIHGDRRSWVWAELGLSPLANALPALVTLAEITESPLGGLTPQAIADAYTAGAWRADSAALDALAAPGGKEDVDAVKTVVDRLYRPWLQDSAEAFQQSVMNQPWPQPASAGKPDSPKPGTCWLFTDGLRYDVGQRLAEALEQEGCMVQRNWQWAALPGVTPTAKPAVSPVAHLLGPGIGFTCTVQQDGVGVGADTLRRELAKAGYAVLLNDETGTPTGSAWTECGALDTTGHSLGWKLAHRIPAEVREIAARIRALMDAGWQEVRVVTDHGWLLLPFGLPKIELPEHLTEARKGRCARLKATTSTTQQIVAWRWDKNVRIAVPPGIGCYIAGQEYEHGGLSVQECVTPVLIVRSTGPIGPPAAIADVRWKRLRCRIQVTGGSHNMSADIRTKAAAPDASIVETVKHLDAEGQVSLAVPDDSLAGTAAVVVLLAQDGSVLAQQHTTIGGDD